MKLKKSTIGLMRSVKILGRKRLILVKVRVYKNDESVELRLVNTHTLAEYEQYRVTITSDYYEQLEDTLEATLEGEYDGIAFAIRLFKELGLLF